MFLKEKKTGSRCFICLFSGLQLPFSFEEQAVPHRPAKQLHPKLRVMYFLLLSPVVCDLRILGRNFSAFLEWFCRILPMIGSFSVATLEVTLRWPNKSEDVTY